MGKIERIFPGLKIERTQNKTNQDKIKRTAVRTSIKKKHDDVHTFISIVLVAACSTVLLETAERILEPASSAPAVL